MFWVSLVASRRTQLSFGILIVLAFAAVAVQAQTSKNQDENKPLFADFRGVRLGMAADEARKKLGSPSDKGDEVDVYVLNDNHSVQVYYDKDKTVSAISIDFMTGASDIPAPKDIIGGDLDTRPDGSSYKMVRYPKAGYWVAYSRTAGASPTITITMQKIQ